MEFAILQQSPPPQALQQNEEGPWHVHPHPRPQACAATSPSQCQLHKHHQLSEPRTLPLATESCQILHTAPSVPGLRIAAIMGDPGTRGGFTCIQGVPSSW